MQHPDPREQAARLAAPFDPAELKRKPQMVSGNRALVITFVDARVVEDRLDEVLGAWGWQDSYEMLPDGAVVCTLRCFLGGQWVTKQDVGGQSGQPDEGDRVKAAFSDALKRAAVKFGVGRYLYRLKAEWCDYDPRTKQITAPQAPQNGGAAPLTAADKQQLADLTAWLGADPPLSAVNDKLAVLSGMSRAAKAAAWKALKAHAGARGWAFDAERVRFAA